MCVDHVCCMTFSIHAFLFLLFLFPHVFPCATCLLRVCLCAFVCGPSLQYKNNNTSVQCINRSWCLILCFSYIVVTTVHIVNSHQTLKCERNINHRLEDITTYSSFPLTFDLKSRITTRLDFYFLLHVVHAAVTPAFETKVFSNNNMKPINGNHFRKNKLQ